MIQRYLSIKNDIDPLCSLIEPSEGFVTVGRIPSPYPLLLGIVSHPKPFLKGPLYSTEIL
jgi:hypothetical protein